MMTVERVHKAFHRNQGLFNVREARRRKGA